MKKRNKWKSATAIGTVFVVITLVSVCVMPAIAAEESSSEVTSSEQPHFDRWAEQRDMSNFSRYIPPIEKKAVPNETLELLYPGLVVWNSSRIVNGEQWIHSDPTWNVFDNPHVYNQSGFSHIHMWRMSDADDSIYGVDPYGDQLLHWWNDFGIREDLGELDRYN